MLGHTALCRCADSTVFLVCVCTKNDLIFNLSSCTALSRSYSELNNIKFVFFLCFKHAWFSRTLLSVSSFFSLGEMGLEVLLMQHPVFDTLTEKALNYIHMFSWLMELKIYSTSSVMLFGVHMAYQKLTLNTVSEAALWKLTCKKCYSLLLTVHQGFFSTVSHWSG